MKTQVLNVSILVDLRKAFDTANHTRLLSKLAIYGVRGVALDWFKSYLSNRTVTCGVPQGLILGPLLFLIYVNDLPNVSSFLDTYLFANDTNWLYICDGEKSKLNIELNKMLEWIKKNELSLNISKTLQFLEKNDITLELDDELLFKQSLVTYLGIKIDGRFNFTSHI